MIPVYLANSFTELITLIQNSRKRGNRRFSYRQLADKLGYRSPRSLAMVHKGQRLPNQNLVRKLIYNFGFSPHEIELTFLFVEKAHAEHKKLPQTEIDKKIAILKKYIEKNYFEKENQLAKEQKLFLSIADYNTIEKKIEDLLCELKSKNTKADPSAQQYIIRFQLVVEDT